MKTYLKYLLVLSFTSALSGQESIQDIAYKAKEALSEEEAEVCTLDLYIPEGKVNFPTVVFFHGGGLRGGDKRDCQYLYEQFLSRGIAVAAPNYRMHPQVSYPGYIEDSAAASAWVYSHITDYNGDPEKIFISGHSAGGYLAMMLGLDRSYLEAAGFPYDKLAGIISISGQTVVHSTVIRERNLKPRTLRVDAAAPLYHINKEACPLLLICGDEDMPVRVEENQLLAAKMKAWDHEATTILVVPKRTHSTIVTKMAEPEDPGFLQMLTFINEWISD